MTTVSVQPASARSSVGLSDRIPVLDSLRGAAILAVFAYHAFFWSGMQTDGWLSRAIALATRPGWLGVDLFFVLSGFLITGRLLDRKHAAARDYYAWFYTRRALRILPLYYAILAVVGSVMLWAGETSWSFLAASAIFAPNIALLMGAWSTAPLALLWSLGVEEQVYLVWPFLVRSLTARRLAQLFIALGLLEPLLRYAAFSTGAMRDGISIATWFRLDGFAWGGFLAIAVRAVGFQARRLAAIGGAAIATAAGVAAASAWTGYLSRRTAVGSAVQLACADLLFAGVLAVALGGPSGVAGRARRSVLGYFGRISYCLYLIHLFAFWSFDRLARMHAPMPLGPMALRAVIVLAVSTAIAELSWRYVEGPCLALKPWTRNPSYGAQRLREAPLTLCGS